MEGAQSLFISLPFIGVVTIVAGVALLVGASQDGKESHDKSDTVRHVYLYLTSFATLLIASSAIVTLIAIGVQSLSNDPSFQSPPPSLYIVSNDPKPLGPTDAGAPEITCTTECSLTEYQRNQITDWTAEYRNWKKDTARTNSQAQGVVAGLSFLIIGALVYVFHWRLARRERTRADGTPLMVRSIYMWAMSFVMLVTIVVSGGFVINTLLKTVVPGAQDSTSLTKTTPAPTDTALMDQLATCGATCNLDADTVSYAQSWQTDFENWSTHQNDRSLATQLADTLPFLIVAIPLFWYHFRTVRRESKKQTTPPTSTI